MYRLAILKRSKQFDHENEKQELLVDRLRREFEKLTLQDKTSSRAAASHVPATKGKAGPLGKRKKKRETDYKNKSIRMEKMDEKRGKKRGREKEESEDEEGGLEFKSRKTTTRGTTL